MEPKSPPKQRLQMFPGLWIFLGVLVLVGTCLAWQRFRQPPDITQLAQDFSSIHALEESPVVNHAGTLVGLVHNTPHGEGIFIANLPAKSECAICEAADVEDIGEPRVYGWSPDDNTFSYRWNTALHFANTNGVVLAGEIPVPFLATITWVSPDSCACIDATTTNFDHDMQLAIVKHVRGKWQQTAAWPLPAIMEKAASLMALDGKRVAWLASNSLWQMDLSSGETRSLYSDSSATLASVAYSKETGKFLLLETINRGRSSSLIEL